jgi:TolB-like protein
LKKIGGLIAAFAAVGTVLAGLTGYWTTYRTFTKEILAPVKREPIAPSLSVVVLPFSNLTGDAAQDYLGDVIAEELTTSLSHIPHSFVIARSTAFTYKGKAVDVRQIGRDLGVRYILEGSQQQGASYRVGGPGISTSSISPRPNEPPFYELCN